MPENYLQNKELTWRFQFLLFRSSNKIFKKKSAWGLISFHQILGIYTFYMLVPLQDFPDTLLSDRLFWFFDSSDIFLCKTY